MIAAVYLDTQARAGVVEIQDVAPEPRRARCVARSDTAGGNP